MNRTALVTGGARGIGAACCVALAAKGWNVVVADRDREEAERMAASLGGSALAVAVDVTDRDSVRAACAEGAAHFGGLGALVTSAGIIDPEPSVDVTPERWRRLLAVNLDGSFVAAQEAHPHLVRAGGGSIVMISSIAAHIGMARRASYAASKGGVEALVRVLANEWAGAGIRVNAVAPGYVRTPLVESAIREGKVVAEDLERNIPLGRMAEPSDLAEIVAFFASKESWFVTGQTLVADGGMTTSGAQW